MTIRNTITDLSKHVKNWNKIIILCQEKNQGLPSNFNMKLFILFYCKIFQ